MADAIPVQGKKPARSKTGPDLSELEAKVESKKIAPVAPLEKNIRELADGSIRKDN